jgi:hypothetical protein
MARLRSLAPRMGDAGRAAAGALPGREEGTTQAEGLQGRAVGKLFLWYRPGLSASAGFG